jgi:hypothetical protein
MGGNARIATAALATLTLSGCMSGSTDDGASAPPASALSKPCTVTVPNGDTPPGETASSGHHGNGSVWTAYAPSGVLRSNEVRPDGSREIKFPWWIAEYSGTTTMDHELNVSGTRTDANSPPLRVEMPCCYHGGFQASALVFPTAGCWRINARPRSGAGLTFVVQLVR